MLLHTIVAAANIFGPSAFDVGEYGDDFIVGQEILKSRHVGFVVAADQLRRSELRDVEEYGPRVMPGMAALVVWRGR